MAAPKPRPPTACTVCGRSGVRLQRREPPTCGTCYKRHEYHARAARKAEAAAAREAKQRDQAQHRAAERVQRRDEDFTKSLRRYGTVDEQVWRRRAACTSTPTEVFFADDTTAAATACAGCEVRPECAAWAISDPTQQGYAGGTTEHERVAARQRIA